MNKHLFFWGIMEVCAMIQWHRNYCLEDAVVVFIVAAAFTYFYFNSK